MTPGRDGEEDNVENSETERSALDLYAGVRPDVEIGEEVLAMCFDAVLDNEGIWCAVENAAGFFYL